MRSYRIMEIDYSQIDGNIVALVKALNSFDGLGTVESCGGHAPDEAWRIYFKIDRTDAGFLSAEFLTWLFNDDLPLAQYKVRIGIDSAPPYLNEPGNCLTFKIEGKADPEEIAKLIFELKEDCFVSTPSDEYDRS